MASLNLQTPLTFLKGVGEQRAAMLLKELELETCYDLLHFFPFRYIDRTDFTTVKAVKQNAFTLAELREVQMKGFISKMHIVGAKQGRRLIATFSDNTDTMELVWFNGINWLQKSLKEDVQYIVYGKPSIYNGVVNMMHPEMEPAAQSDFQLSGKIQPIYSGTEKLKSRGINSKMIARFVQSLIAQLSELDLPEQLPASVIQKYKLIGRFEAYKCIHFPDSDAHLQHALRRLKFEELFIDQIKLLRVKQYRHSSSMGFIFKELDTYFNPFYTAHMPFELTNAQKRVMKEIRKDLLSGRQMNRLLQGDVGSGKTVVALLTMLMALDNGFQACLMAPTEILSQQHIAGISELLKDLPIQVALLTGSVKGKQRKLILEGVADGSIQILIGTHALIEETVQFKNLGCVVIDEQHRFGVEQRSK
ncbi:MAG TPA: DEAD/DEAH box helicase, partial [Chitinophagales bacterium]|nr:DEAD/DEAH box helicase [Chitinophagales bacterium]HNO29867.1 DEAD/DEAH box helicase [Chitinophagales bacterium]